MEADDSQVKLQEIFQVMDHAGDAVDGQEQDGQQGDDPHSRLDVTDFAGD